MQKPWWSFLLLLLASSAQAAELKFEFSDFAPFHYLRDGVVVGPAVELVSKVCAEAHIECSFKVLPWRRAQNDVRQGKAHGAFVIGWNEARAKWLHFSPPIVRTEFGFFVLQDNPLQFTSLEDVKGYTVAVYGPTYISRYLEQLKAHHRLDLTLDIAPKGEHGFGKVALGRVDAVYSNKDVGNHLIQQLGLTNLRYAGTEHKGQYYIGLSKQSVEKALVNRFHAALVELYRRGEAQAILRQGGLTPTDLK
jgi:polar amino acid transport system substrate-binding protein